VAGGFKIMDILLFFFFPFLSLFLIFLIPSRFKNFIFLFSIFLILIHFSYFLYFIFKNEIPFFQKIRWIKFFNINLSFYIDNLSISLIILNFIIFITGLLFSIKEIEERVKEFLIWCFLLLAGINGVFISSDLFLFFLSWEFMLIPMFFIIKDWGYEKREYASFKFLIYTMTGSSFLITGILITVFYFKNLKGFFSFDIFEISKISLPYNLEKILFFLFIISFLIKIPLFPFHTWLPDAHTQAPSFGSAILAGILLKTGAYGILRIILNFFPNFSKEIKDIIIILSLFNIIYSPLMAIVQKDLKRLIAYSSIGHMGFITVGIFTFEKEGIQGSIFQIFNHGITISALFMIAGAIYKRKGTREIEKLGGLASKIPILSFIFALFMLSGIGLPGLNNFAGEFLIIYALFKNNVFVAMISLIGIILTCAYFLTAYRKSIFGEYKGEEIRDLRINEILSFIPLIFLIFYLGLYPKIFLENFKEITLWK